jgi:acetolactate synthase I/II/III large subunit
MPRVYEALAAGLVRSGVRVAFGLVSEETAKLTVELTRHGVAYTSTRHEAIAIGMADGYARVSGELGVAIVGRGPGLTNALSPLVSAAKGRAEILVLAGDSDAGINEPAAAEAARSQEKYIDQTMLLRAAGVPSVRLTSPASVLAAIEQLCERARAGTTIVANLPMDVLEAEAGDDDAELDLPPAPASPAAPDPADIATVVDLLEEQWLSRRLVVLAGRGAVGAKEELTQLADRCGALLATSLMARSLFNGHPYNAGVAGTFSTPPAVELFTDATLVIAFGASLNEFTTLRGELFPNATIVQIDRNPDALGRHQPVTLGITADARLTAAALLEELDRRRFTATGYHTDEAAAKIADFRIKDTIGDQGQPGALDPRILMLAIDAVIPKNRALAVDSGNNWIWSSAHLSVAAPTDYLSRLEYYCVGCGLGPALGAALARPDRITVFAVGDGGLMMTLADLDTAVRLNLPLLILVFNDGMFGSDVHFLQWAGFSDEIARVPAASFEDIARGFGADALTIANYDDVEELGERIQHLDGPLLADCRVTSEIRPAVLGRETLVPAGR